MNAMNRLFMDNPVDFLKAVCVDNKTMQEGLDGAKNLVGLNETKFGYFDLVITGGNMVRLTCASLGAIPKVQNDVPIQAYWCPFLQGGGLPGWVDIPRINPPRRLVLIAAMQGCAFIITNSPVSAQHFRLFHNQHPETKSTWAAIQQSGITATISTLSYEQYGNPSGNDGGMTNAFNLLWRPSGKAWSYVSQSNKFVPLPKGTKIERDLAKPILDLPAGV